MDGGQNPGAAAADESKRRAALAALELVESGMKLGLGTGSTADAFVRGLGERVRNGLEIVGVPTSERTSELAESLSIPLTTLDEQPSLDMTIDGADELDRQLRLIKGGGGALLREKIVAAASARMVVIADDSKLVDTLGAFPLPIEVAPFGLGATQLAISKVAADLSLTGPLLLRKRPDGTPYVTDGGHYIIDASFGVIGDPESLAGRLDAVPGVVGHGIFIGLATEAILAGPGGLTRLTAA